MLESQTVTIDRGPAFLSPLAGTMSLALATTLSLLCYRQIASAWSGDGHADVITQDVLDHYTAFSSWATANGVYDDVLEFVRDADHNVDNTLITNLDQDADNPGGDPALDIWESDDNIAIDLDGDIGAQQALGFGGRSMWHTYKGGAQNNLMKDPRFHNAVELLDLAIKTKATNIPTSIMLLMNGAHYLQDYAAHLNAPGRGLPGSATDVSHGLIDSGGGPVEFDSDGNGSRDMQAGTGAVDNTDWDNHSDSGVPLADIPYSLREADLYNNYTDDNAGYYHKHANYQDGWRYKTAFALTLQLLKGYHEYNSSAEFVKAVNLGYIDDGATRYYIDLLTRHRTIVDNKDNEFGTFTTNGTWNGSTAVSGYFGTGYKVDSTSGADSSSTWAQWTLDVPSTDSYQVYMRWPATATRPDAAPVTIVHSGGTANTTVNQQANGGKWNLIGTYDFTVGTSGSVKIVATDSGYTEADAVMLVRQPVAEVTVDNAGAGFTTDAAWTAATTVAGYNGTNYAHDNSSGADPSKWAKWTPTIAKAGNYKLYMRWPANGTFADAVPVEIIHANGTDSTKTVNQTQNGGTWNLIGTYDLAAGTGNSVKVTASDAGFTIADAVMFVPVPRREIVIDNNDYFGRFTSSGDWTTSTALLNEFYGENYLHDGNSSSGGAKWAKWTPNITSAGTYKIYMRWPESGTRPDAAPVEIKYNGGSNTANMTVNQTTNGSQWNLIGTYSLSAGTGNSVKITDADAGYTEADAVRFVKVE